MSILIRRAMNMQSQKSLLDAFSVDLFTGGNTTITNGLDLLNDGGMVWQKRRDVVDAHELTDTVNGAGKYLQSNATSGFTINANTVTSFNNNGYSMGSGYAAAGDFVSWAFKNAPKFFQVKTDVVQSGNWAVSHNLGIQCGVMIVKRQANGGNWVVYHKDMPTNYTYLNTASAQQSSGSGNIVMTDTSVTTRSLFGSFVGQTCQVLAFADDTSPEGIIRCGRYTGNGVAGTNQIDLGWKPKFIMIKGIEVTASWLMVDSTRGEDQRLYADSTGAEVSQNIVDFTNTGFTLSTSNFYNSNRDYIYVAIRDIS
jgi:hypothetical protein